eukprot:GHVU01053415.1.p3 GENE.GHVU01053415.1~~GHVU01053415.1.p3  ORF type:complete len:112 (+),score=6.74 GHVU01053415.1:152-487(+)
MPSPSPIYLSSKLYAWEGAGSDERVAYDATHGRVLHQTPDGFLAIDTREDGAARDGALFMYTCMRACMCACVCVNASGCAPARASMRLPICIYLPFSCLDASAPGGNHERV